MRSSDNHNIEYRQLFSNGWTSWKSYNWSDGVYMPNFGTGASYENRVEFRNFESVPIYGFMTTSSSVSVNPRIQFMKSSFSFLEGSAGQNKYLQKSGPDINEINFLPPVYSAEEMKIKYLDYASQTLYNSYFWLLICDSISPFQFVSISSGSIKLEYYDKDEDEMKEE